MVETKKSKYEYEVNTTHIKQKSRLDASYFTQVTVYEDGEVLLDASSSYWSYTPRGARKKAYKHIKDCQAEAEKGNDFGVIFGLRGTAEVVSRELQ